MKNHPVCFLYKLLRVKGRKELEAIQLAVFDPGTKLFNSPLIFPRYSKVDTK